MLQRLLAAPPLLRATLSNRGMGTFCSRHYASASNVTQSSFWLNMVPKPLRKSSRDARSARMVKSREWNPSTFFIIIFLLIGSNSIQMIALKKDFATFSRRAEAQIVLLREIIEKIQNGEEVDVEGLLGTGDKEREKEWDEVLQEIEKENEAWEHSQRHKPRHGKNMESSRKEERIDSNPSRKVERTTAPPGFY